jgi:hypothetical protein
VEPLAARCRACGSRTALAVLASVADGRCPGCGELYSERWTVLLVEECGAVEHLAQALVRSLRRISGLPGNLELQPDALFANLRDEVPWGRSIDAEPALITAEIERLSERLETTELPPGIAAEVQALAGRLASLATMLDAHQEATDPDRVGAGRAALRAARRLDEAVDALVEGRGDAEGVRTRLRDAADAV